MLVVDQAVVVDLLPDLGLKLLQQQQEGQEILPLNLHPHHPFKVTLVEQEQVTNLAVVVEVALQQLVEMVVVELVETLVQEALENKIILILTTITGPVVVAVDLTLTLVELVELVAEVEVDLIQVIVLELVVDQQLMQVQLLQVLEMVELVELILVVEVVLVILMVLMVQPAVLELLLLDTNFNS